MCVCGDWMREFVLKEKRNGFCDVLIEAWFFSFKKKLLLCFWSLWWDIRKEDCDIDFCGIYECFAIQMGCYSEKDVGLILVCDFDEIFYVGHILKIAKNTRIS